MSSYSPPPGSVLRDPEGSLMRRIVMVTVLLPFALIFVSFFTGSTWVFLVGAAVLAVLMLASRHSLSAMLKWDPPQLEMTAAPYALGSEPTLVYHRRPKRPTDIADASIECRLTCQERATYTQGTDTVTDTRKVIEQDCGGAGYGTPHGLQADLVVPISANAGAPTFDLGNNEVAWFVEIQARGPGLPRDKHTFVINVGPELDPSLRARVQDT